MSISTSSWPRWGILLFLGLVIGHTVVTISHVPGWLFPLPTAAWLGLARWRRWGIKQQASGELPRKRFIWALVPLVLWGIYVYLVDNYGQADIGALFFHLQAGIAQHGGGERNLIAIIYTTVMLLVLVAYVWLIRQDLRWRRWDPWLAAILLIGNPVFYTIGQRSAAVVATPGAWLEQRYVAPTILKAPQRPPNLLVLYLESLERTYGDSEKFGNAYADIKALEPKAVVFDNVQQMDNTGWTMAGMIASQCGTPLIPAGLLHDSQFEPLHQVAPGVDCLGDLLKQQGYHLTFMGGASKAFAGKGLFYEGHDFDQVFGRDELSARLDDPEYLNSWGLYDDSLYEFVSDEIRRQDASPGPWAMVALNLSAHAPEGYPSQSCAPFKDDYEDVDILYAVKCSGWLTRRLLERLQAEGLLDNTLVVVASDHLTMRVSAWEDLLADKRTNTLLMMGNGLTPRVIHKPATTMDTFPTILEAMGFTIDWHRAGLGVSLLSTEPTLVQRHGIDELNRYMREETALQERIWLGETPPNQTGEDDTQPEQEAPVAIPEQP